MDQELEYDVYQCCYTHSERSDTVNEGWDTVAVSPDIPAEVLRSCRRFQNADCPDRSGITDERGRVLDLYETAGDGNYIYVIRTRYGHTDALGRPSMFSHAFAFPIDGSDVLEDPNAFLALDRSNFKDNEEDAAGWEGDFTEIEPLELPEAMRGAGLDRNRYAVLVRCVYAQMSGNRNPKPLYVYYDGTDEQLRCLLYCVYYGIPYAQRRLLCTASSANGVNLNKNLIFSEHARRKENYLIPQTGENTILIPRVERKINRFGYIDHAAVRLPPDQFPEFFQLLDDNAIRYGDPFASNEQVLKLSYQFMIHDGKVSSFNDEELEGNLSTALLCGTDSEALETDMARLLEEANRRNLRFPGDLESALEERLTSATTPRLRQAGLQYNTRKLYQPTVEEAAERLFALPEESVREYGELLCATPQGLEILECYFQTVLEETPPTWDLLSRVWDLSGEILTDAKMRERLAGELEGKAWELYDKDARPGENAVNALQEYAQLMRKLLPPWRYEDCMQSAKEVYWEQVRFSDFFFQYPVQYEQFRLDTQRCRMYAAFSKLPEAYSPGGEGTFLRKLYRFFHHNLWVPEREKGQALRRLYEFLRERYGSLEPEFPQWMSLAADADTPELLESVQILYAAVRNFDAAKLNEAYPVFLAQCADARQGTRMASQVLELLEPACAKHDSKENPVSLDLWLRIGNNRPGNCFKIFDQVSAAVLEQDPAATIAQSELMKLEFYRESAEKYVYNRGKKSRAVKRLLAACPTDENAPQQEKKSLFARLRG